MKKETENQNDTGKYLMDKLPIGGVMQAEGSDESEGAAVGKERGPKGMSERVMRTIKYVAIFLLINNTLFWMERVLAYITPSRSVLSSLWFILTAFAVLCLIIPKLIEEDEIKANR